MRNCIPYVALFLFFGLLAKTGMADDTSLKVPLEQAGHAVANVNLSGAKYSIQNDTAAVATVPILLYGVIMEECAATAGYDLYDATATTNNTESNRVLPTTECESTTLPTYRTFDPPLRLSSGLSVDIVALVSGGSSSATFVYTELYQ